PTAWVALTTLVFALPASNPTALAQAAETASGTTGLILQADEGERRVRRTGDFPFILKVDKQNGGSTHFVKGAGDLKAGPANPTPPASACRRDRFRSQRKCARHPRRPRGTRP